MNEGDLYLNISNLKLELERVLKSKKYRIISALFKLFWKKEKYALERTNEVLSHLLSDYANEKNKNCSNEVRIKFSDRKIYIIDQINVEKYNLEKLGYEILYVDKREFVDHYSLLHGTEFKVICDDKTCSELRIDNKHLLRISDGNINLPELYDCFFKTIRIPKISVIVLNYNNDGFIQRCIDSLIEFNNYNYEIIIVDNGSKDGSFENLRKYGSKIKLIQNTKNGCSSGRNLGVEHSNGEILVFLDSDQWILNWNWMHFPLDSILQNKKIGAIGWNAGWLFEKSFLGPTVDDYDNRAILPNMIYRTDINYLATSGMIVRKDLFNKINGFDVRYDPTCFEDTDISLSILNEGYDIAYCPYFYIDHTPHQSTKDGTKAHMKRLHKNGIVFLEKWRGINSELLRSQLIFERYQSGINEGELDDKY